MLKQNGAHYDCAFWIMTSIAIHFPHSPSWLELLQEKLSITAKRWLSAGISTRSIATSFQDPSGSFVNRIGKLVECRDPRFYWVYMVKVIFCCCGYIDDLVWHFSIDIGLFGFAISLDLVHVWPWLHRQSHAKCPTMLFSEVIDRIGRDKYYRTSLSW